MSTFLWISLVYNGEVNLIGRACPNSMIDGASLSVEKIMLLQRGCVSIGRA